MQKAQAAQDQAASANSGVQVLYREVATLQRWQHSHDRRLENLEREVRDGFAALHTALARRFPSVPPSRERMPSAHDLADELVHHPSFAKQLGGIMQLNWPTAVVVGTFVLGGVALSITHHDLPTWMMAVLGAIAAAATNRIAGGSNAR